MKCYYIMFCDFACVQHSFLFLAVYVPTGNLGNPISKVVCYKRKDDFFISEITYIQILCMLCIKGVLNECLLCYAYVYIFFKPGVF